jgi:tether containing UBX domain for GLUT4
VVECEQSSVQLIKIALQLEHGGRVIGNYSSDETLDKVVAKAKDKLEIMDDSAEPVIIYMRQEIIGEQALASTSLKKLGLTGGSAVLRLIHRTPGSLTEQV